MRRHIKTLLEWMLALALLLLLALPMALVALIVLVADGVPILHREQRLGRHGRRFTLAKFRTLRSSDGASVAPVGDSRIFPAAAPLRRWRLDELPQLLNVLRGDMALVGPRPLPARHAEALPPETRSRLLQVRPGVTGRSALAFLGDDVALGGVDDFEERYLRDVLPAKVALDVDYLDHWSLGADFALLAQTLRQIVSRSARERSRDRVRRLLDAHGSQEQQ